MGIDEIFDLDLEISESDLDSLDNQAAQAQKRFDKIIKRKDQIKKEFEAAASKEEKARIRAEKKYVAKIKREEAKQKREEERELKTLQGILDKAETKKLRADEKADARLDARAKKRAEQARRWEITGDQRTWPQRIFGGAISSNPRVALTFFKNPADFVRSIMHAIPILGGILAAKEIADFIVAELLKIDRFFKKFRDIADDRVNIFLNRQDEALVRIGLSQRISTTRAGIIDPRDSYNSYEEFNSNAEALENRYATRTTGGVE